MAAIVGIPALTYANAVGNQVLGGFQIDGNLTQADYGTGVPPVAPPAGSVDWNSTPVQINADGVSQPQPVDADPISTADTSVYSTGSKEGQDPSQWTINTSAGASPKGDMGNIYFWSHIDPVTNHIFGYLGIERLSTSGTVDYFVELNQKKNVLSADGTVSVPNRTVNDIRLQVTDHGASGWQVTATGDRWGPCPSPLPSGVTCVGGNTWIEDKALTAEFYGLVDDNTITDPSQFNSQIAAQNKPAGVLVANQFTEFSVDLTAAGYVPDVCGTTVFAQLNVRSVASLSPTSESKDFAQTPVRTPNPCASITVTKQDMSSTTITNNPATFTFAPDPTLPSSDPNYASSSLTVTDGSATGVCVPVRTPCPGDADGTVNGVVKLNTVQIGATNIKVTESSPPSGYFTDTPAFQTIAGPLVSGTDYPLTFKDPLGSITWQKWDASTGTPVTVAGAQFTVTATGGAAFAAPWSTPGHPFTRTVTDNGTNDDNSTAGLLALSGLPAGTYSITETTPPPGFLLPQPPADTITGVVVNSTTPTDAGHFSDPLGALAWQKQDLNGAPLAGATFQLNYPGGALYNVVDSTGPGTCTPVAPSGPTPGTACDMDPTAGNFLLTGLKTGTYTITETVAPPGYTLSSTVLSPTITDTSWATVNAGPVFDGQGSIQWNKVGPDGKTALCCATFRLDGPGGFSELVTDNGLDDADSAAGSIKVIGLAPGPYTITEVTPPAGYLLPVPNNPALSATVPAAGTTTVQAGTITDPLGALVWHKVGPDGQTPLAGATFNVTFPDSSVFTVVDNTGSGTCTPAAPSGSTPGIACDTDATGGNFKLEGVPAGAYTITETIPPAGYLLPASGNPLSVTIHIGDNTGPVDAGTLTDPLGAIKWTKVGADGLTPLGGATFQVKFPDGSLYNVADNTGSGTCTPVAPVGSTPGTACDANPAGGVFELDGLKTGAYIVTETAPPPGYLMPTSGNPLTATIGISDNGGPVSAGTLSDPLGSIKWTKFGPDGTTPLAGATFAVTFPDGLVYTVVDNTGVGACAPQPADPLTPGVACDSDTSGGGFLLDGLKTGTYTITETVPPTGYLLPATGNPLTATIGINDNTGAVNAGSLTDPLGAVKWTKFGPDGKTPLGGATFTITGPNSFSETVVDDGANDANKTPGLFEVDGLKTGTYTITETVPPPGYLMPTSGNPLTATITVNDNQGPVDAGSLTDPLGAVKWTKFGPDGTTPLGGATFTITGPNSFSETVVDDGANDANKTPGLFEVDGLMTGTYTITETVPPPGYLMPVSGNPLTATIGVTDNTGPVSAGSLTDPLGGVKWTKFGPDGKTPLGGATFVITGPNEFTKTVVDNGPNDANKAAGLFEVDGLKTGDYTITETVPPPGYLMPISGNPLHATITVNDNTGAVSAGSLTDPLGSIEWRKLNADTHGPIPVAGTKFTLVATGGPALTVFHFSKTVVDNGVNDADSRISYIKVTNVPAGTYTITEIAAPPAFMLPATGRSITGVVVGITSTATVQAGAISDPPFLPVVRPGHPTLPDTGGPDLAWLLWGGGLLLAGLVLMVSSKYRRNRKA